MAHVDLRIEGRVALLRFSNPPVNALSHALRSDLVVAIGKATADPAVAALVLCANENFFCAGADVSEFGTPAMMSKPSLHDLIETVEGNAKPIIAAIDGTCMGGGFELALGCHYRVASAKARFALPEIKLGIIPGAGGTQRLPRLAGVERALRIILSGEVVSPEYFASTAVLDLVCQADAAEAARAWAEAGNAKTPPPRVRDRQLRDPAMGEITARALQALSPDAPQDAAGRLAVSSVQATALPFEEGEKRERTAFMTLLDSPESKALRHAFFAERTASRVPGLAADTPVRSIQNVAVIGAGTMGTGIAMAVLESGLSVKLLELNAEAAARGVANIRKTYEGAVAKGRITAEQLEKRMKLLEVASDYQAIASVDLAIEAVFEQMDVKKQVLQRLDATLKPGAILASNTSTLDLDVLAASTSRPQDVIGLHFFSPANVMRLLEIVRGKATAPDVLATAMAFAKRIRKVAVVAGVCDGFIGNRMIEQYVRQALFMLDEGASPAQVDDAIERFGFAMGPFRMSDLAGNDIGWAIRKRRYVERPEVTYSSIGDKLCELGRFGQKTLGGWYDYQAGNRKALESPVVAKLLEEHRASIGAKPRKLESKEIVERLLGALVDEGEALLKEGIAARASDIDVVYLYGYGFPRWRGGPMFHAEQAGLGHGGARKEG